ncbi:uroporphyrinogen-III synthase [Vibrio parahaemolyticus]|uniref:uroporphyrinogen-III synthase n=1 Tax=Vibrio mediterranei TaxID=689 RepID=UPI0040684FDF
MRVLVTRPESQGAELCNLIRQMGGYALHHPLINIDYDLPLPFTNDHLLHADIIIAVSQYAVQGLRQRIDNQQLIIPKPCIYLGVGQKTAHELSKLVQQNVNYPAVSDSEHLLALPELVNVANKHVIILRGNGGRELIHEQLTKLGADVEYFEVYRRCYQPLNGDAIAAWRRAQLDTIVVTSGEQLEYLLSQVPESEQTWLRQHTLLVPSERIATLAMTQGFHNVINTRGASNSTLFAALQRLETGLNNDEQK